MSKITILPQSCKGIDGCGICIFVCPKDVLVASENMNELGYLPPKVDDEQLCTGCQNCMIACPDFAIVVKKDSKKLFAKGGGRDE